MDKLILGILAHVDAGKTTLSEAMLYAGGQLRKLGRVDHQNAFLDTDVQERERGITIFSKQAVLPLGDVEFTLLDTPGHVDFSSEMERTLQVLDYAVLVISGTDGVQSHTRTLWQLLERYNVPTFLFVNKMDLDGADRAALLASLQGGLSAACVDFSTEDGDFLENVAMCSEETLAAYLETGRVETAEIDLLLRRVLEKSVGRAARRHSCGAGRRIGLLTAEARRAASARIRSLKCPKTKGSFPAHRGGSDPSFIFAGCARSARNSRSARRFRRAPD